MKSKRPEDWTAEEKLKAIVEYEKLDEQQKGKYLREKGLHSVYLQRWQQEFVEAYTSKKKKPRGGDPKQKRIKELEKELRRKEKALAETAALLVLKKKLRRSGGPRGREIAVVDRNMCIKLVDEAVDSGARRHKACEMLGISVRSLQRWEKEPEKEDQRQGPNSKPENALREAEKMLIIAVATSPQFKDLPPSQIVPILAESGVYIVSEASF